MQDAIAELTKWADVCANNAPIHAASGDHAQAALSAKNAESYLTAIERLKEV